MTSADGTMRPLVNAVTALAARLPRSALARLAPGARAQAAADGDPALVLAVERSFELDLVALLNRLRAAELDHLARGLGLATAPAEPRDAGALRTALWRWGATAEAGGDALLGTPVQPIPTTLGARLCHPAPPRGLSRFALLGLRRRLHLTLRAHQRPHGRAAP